MKNNLLFLEGPIQTGKSTLIRKLLGEHIDECGGFTSQRMTDDAGNTVGFRIGPAASTPLSVNVEDDPARTQGTDAPARTQNANAPANIQIVDGPVQIQIVGEPSSAPKEHANTPASSLADIITSYPGVFKYFDHDKGKVYKDQSVFNELGVELLSPPAGCRLMLLDEIGGAELLSEPFKKTLYDLLASGIPCLGVLKLAESTRRMQHNSRYDTVLTSLNEQLRSYIKDTLNGNILYYARTEHQDYTPIGQKEAIQQSHGGSSEELRTLETEISREIRGFIDSVFHHS